MSNRISGISKVAAVAERCCGGRPLQRRGHIKAIIAAKAFHSILHVLSKASSQSDDNHQHNIKKSEGE